VALKFHEAEGEEEVDGHHHDDKVSEPLLSVEFLIEGSNLLLMSYLNS
jgi:hypothetical protein